MNETSVAMKTTEANQIVKKYVATSMVAALIPIPVFDLIALTGIQLKLLHRLSKLYQVPYSANLGKSLIASLLGGVTSVRAGLLTASATKTVPGLGTLSSIAGVLVVGGASTYAIGKVFIQHFESGGTFLTFDPEAVRKHFVAEFERGKQVVEELKTDSSDTTGPNTVETSRPAGEPSPGLEASAGFTAPLSKLEAFAGEEGAPALREESIVTKPVVLQPAVETPEPSPEPTVSETIVTNTVVSQPFVESQEPSPKSTVTNTTAEAQLTSTPPVATLPATESVELQERSFEPTVTETIVTDSVAFQSSVERQERSPEPMVTETIAEVELTSVAPIATPPAKAVDVGATISSVKAVFGEGTKSSEFIIATPPREVEATSPPPAVALSKFDSNSDRELEIQTVSPVSETPVKTEAAVLPMDTDTKSNEPPVITVKEDNNSTKGKRRTRNYGMGRMR